MKVTADTLRGRAAHVLYVRGASVASFFRSTDAQAHRDSLIAAGAERRHVRVLRTLKAAPHAGAGGIGTMAKIGDTNGFKAMKALQRAAADPRIAEIEGGGLDDGRVLLHAARGWKFDGYDSASKSVGSVKELREALSILVRREEA